MRRATLALAAFATLTIVAAVPIAAHPNPVSNGGSIGHDAAGQTETRPDAFPTPWDSH
jgi:hypothetical protein